MLKAPLILHGGVDVNPKYYGEPKGRWTQTPNEGRDFREFQEVAKAMKEDVPVVGICRGAQLLCVVNDGKLHQHTEPDHQNHSIMTHDGHLFLNVAASHHQIMKPQGKCLVLAWNPNPVRIYNDDGTWTKEFNTPEVVYYPEFRHLAVQPHPEWMNSDDPFVEWLNSLMAKYQIAYSF